MPHLHLEKRLLFMCFFFPLALCSLTDHFAVIGSIFLSGSFSNVNHQSFLMTSPCSRPEYRVLKGCLLQQQWGGALRVTSDLGSRPESKKVERLVQWSQAPGPGKGRPLQAVEIEKEACPCAALAVLSETGLAGSQKPL